MSELTMYERWDNEEIKNLGNFQTKLFQAYRYADGTNKAILKRNYPEYFGGDGDPLQSENARLREVLEGVLRLEDLIRYPDTVLPAQHQGEAEAINLMLDKIKAALTTTPKP